LSKFLGLKSSLKNSAFTLIELLVVILIISILAAIALPQYQKAVWKSRAAQLQQSVRDLAQAQEAYWLVHSKYPTNFDELDFNFDSFPQKPSSPLSNWTTSSTNAVRANDNMELIINHNIPTSTHFFSTGLFIKGKFSTNGFAYVHDVAGGYASIGKRKLYCLEYTVKLPIQGDFCNKIMGIYSTPVIVNTLRFFPVN
jgi:prepilin-type N-terminal cleavage/methylation domain-containing protein